MPLRLAHRRYQVLLRNISLHNVCFSFTYTPSHLSVCPIVASTEKCTIYLIHYF